LAYEPSSFLENPYNNGRTFSKLLCASLKPVILTGIHTGLRRGEILPFKWGNIDFKEKGVFIETKKK
jgi:integrase